MLYKLVHKSNPNKLFTTRISLFIAPLHTVALHRAIDHNSPKSSAVARSTPNIELESHGGFATLIVVAAKAPNFFYPSIWVKLIFSVTLGEDPISNNQEN